MGYTCVYGSSNDLDFYQNYIYHSLNPDKYFYNTINELKIGFYNFNHSIYNYKKYIEEKLYPKPNDDIKIEDFISQSLDEIIQITKDNYCKQYNHIISIKILEELEEPFEYRTPILK